MYDSVLKRATWKWKAMIITHNRHMSHTGPWFNSHQISCNASLLTIRRLCDSEFVDGVRPLPWESSKCIDFWSVSHIEAYGRLESNIFKIQTDTLAEDCCQTENEWKLNNIQASSSKRSNFAQSNEANAAEWIPHKWMGISDVKMTAFRTQTTLGLAKKSLLNLLNLKWFAIVCVLVSVWNAFGLRYPFYLLD